MLKNTNTIWLEISNRIEEMDYELNEAHSIAFILLEELFSISRMDILTQKEISFSKSNQKELVECLQKISLHTPIQHITKRGYFYDNNFIVNENVLIPRPETEELVHLILNENKTKENLSILDIGTGSGCIAITLDLNLKSSRVEAVDISSKALDVAKLNARNLMSKVKFSELDILNASLKVNHYDIIVSNPPYITNSEKVEMKKNVLDYEPHSALFVEDTIPLLFYDKIVSDASTALKKGGMLYFEINEAYGNEVADLITLKNNFINTQIIKDLQGKNRIVKSTKA